MAGLISDKEKDDFFKSRGWESRTASDWQSEVVGIRKDEDMVCALEKSKGV